MNDNRDNYDIAAIRRLLLAAFQPETLHRFCQDRPTFRPIVATFGPRHGLDDMVDEVIDYCANHLLFPELLTDVEQELPRQYQRCGPYHEPQPPGRQHSGPRPPALRVAGELRRSLGSGGRGPSRFSERRYRQHLIHRHRFFDVKGLSTQGIYTLELERVFVELTIAPRPLHEATTDPIQILPENARRGQTIWSYLNIEALAHQNLVIIGPPGCGKTTLLKHMVLILTASYKQRRKWHAPNKLPILLFLRDHALAIQDNPNLSLAQAACDALAVWNLAVAPSWFESRLASGRCLVMFDGLDEIADPDARRQVVAWVQRQMEACGGNRFVITSRPYGYYDHRLSGVAVLQVSPFTRGQVECFVHNWYTANEIMSAQKDDPGVRQDAAKGAADLLQRLRNTQDLADLAVNPLLLTMITTVHRYRSSLPGRRVELYKEICDVFLGQRRQARGLGLDLTPAQKQEVLQPLAYHLMCQARREATLEEAISVVAEPLAHVSPRTSGETFLKGVENESGLLVERESGVYAFSHKTFQEYLASAHVIGNQDLEAELARKVGEDWWHETIRLYAAQTDASAIIEACLAGEPPEISALTLAIECQEEALRLRPALRVRLEEVLTEGVDSPDPARRRLIAEALLALRLRHMVRVDEDRYVDNTLVTHAEYQIFLDEKRAQGKYHQPDHWTGYRFLTGQGLSPVVGVRPSDAIAFCEWLTERATREWCYRLPLVGELEANLVENKEQAGYWIETRNNTAFAQFEIVRPSFPWASMTQRFASDLDYALDQTAELDRIFHHALEGAEELDYSHDRVLQRALDRILDDARSGLNDLSSYLRYAPALVHDSMEHVAESLEFTLDQLRQALECANSLKGVLNRHLDHAGKLDDTFVAQIAILSINLSTLSSFLDIIYTGIIALGRADVNIRNLNIDKAHASPLDLDLVNRIDLDLARASTHYLDLKFDVRGSTNIGLSTGMRMGRYRASVLARDLVRNLDLATERTRTPIPSSQESEIEALCRNVRQEALTLATQLQRDLSDRWQYWASFLIRDSNDRAKGKLQMCMDALLELYVDFAILEARIKGEVPAFEGIRLVRERQPRQ